MSEIKDAIMKQEIHLMKIDGHLYLFRFRKRQAIVNKKLADSAGKSAAYMRDCAEEAAVMNEWFNTIFLITNGNVSPEVQAP
jgi:hypothetical protein